MKSGYRNVVLDWKVDKGKEDDKNFEKFMTQNSATLLLVSKIRTATDTTEVRSSIGNDWAL